MNNKTKNNNNILYDFITPLNEFIDRIFPNRDIDNEDDELFYYRRKMEDEFISKKREWKKSML